MTVKNCFYAPSTSVILKLTCFFILLFCSSYSLYGQVDKQIIQLSGVVTGQDQDAGLPGVHIFESKGGRGTTTNFYGYFSMPVMAGDSLVFSSIGYIRRYLVVPDTVIEKLTVVIEMIPDTTYLEPVNIFPFPTEQDLKEAVLAMDVPIDNYSDDERLGRKILAQMSRELPMDASMNYRYYQNQQFQQLHNRNSFVDPTQALLNPFAWAEFIKSLKKKKKKKKNSD